MTRPSILLLLRVFVAMGGCSLSRCLAAIWEHNIGTCILTGGIYDVFHLNDSGVMTHIPNFIRTGSESFRSLMEDAQTYI
jgi:hypothetical protein